jgi:hypothetical protein
MTKQPTTLYLDREVVEELRRRGLNLSEVVNRYLHALLGLGSKTAQIQAKIWELQKQLLEAAKEELLELQLAEHVEFYKKAEAKGWGNYPGGKQKFLEDTAKKFGLTPGEVLAICEGARPSKFNPGQEKQTEAEG